jgi:uncharacterized CHY-type Zn-finger protein
METVGGVPVRGLAVDARTQCAHYATERDVVAFAFPCCETPDQSGRVFYPCRRCHDALVEHPTATWDRSNFDERAVLCGACGTRLTVDAYLDCESACPACGAAFNPGCVAHRSLYVGV